MTKRRSYLSALLVLLALFAFEIWRGGDWQRLLPWVGGSVVLVAYLVNRETRRGRSSDDGGSSSGDGGSGDGFGGGWSTGGGAGSGWGGSGDGGGDGGD